MNYKKTKQYKKIKEALLNQLEKDSNDTEYFIDLVENYMNLWCIGKMLEDDIDERGIVTTYQNGANQFGTRNNPSVGELLKVNTQMMKILTQLNIKAEVVSVIEDEDNWEL